MMSMENKTEISPSQQLFHWQVLDHNPETVCDDNDGTALRAFILEVILIFMYLNKILQPGKLFLSLWNEKISPPT